MARGGGTPSRREEPSVGTLRTVYAIIDEGQLPAFRFGASSGSAVRTLTSTSSVAASSLALRHLYPATNEEERMGAGRRSVSDSR